MIRFLLTSWWFYIPIITVLLLLTRRNNQKIKEIKARQNPDAHQAQAHQKKKSSSKRIKKVSDKLGLSGAASHVRRRK